mmetsp:Transcript_17088/g.32076  ORF Transcript_17088/g.32076 Transcript_17088/m.32076 type:complete len:202 (-) Transcript_17088:561-1166(-)
MQWLESVVRLKNGDRMDQTIVPEILHDHFISIIIVNITTGRLTFSQTTIIHPSLRTKMLRFVLSPHERIPRRLINSILEIIIQRLKFVHHPLRNILPRIPMYAPTVNNGTRLVHSRKSIALVPSPTRSPIRSHSYLGTVRALRQRHVAMPLESRFCQIAFLGIDDLVPETRQFAQGRDGIFLVEGVSDEPQTAGIDDGERR